MDAVTEILVERSQQADKVGRVVMLSLIAHAILITGFAFAPQWRSQPVENVRTMMISLGGAVGPDQGRNPMSDRPTQAVVPETVKPNTEAPPALAKPEMIEPVKTAKVQPKAAAKPEPQKDVQQLHGSKPTTGPEVKQGTAKVVTHGSAIPFGGLATSSGGGAGAAYTDYADFCCPEYLATMVQLVQKNWQAKQGQDGTVQVKFTIQRDGMMTGIEVEQQSTQFLNLAAQRAVITTKQLPPLPAAFTGDRLTVHLVFQFKR